MQNCSCALPLLLKAMVQLSVYKNLRHSILILKHNTNFAMSFKNPCYKYEKTFGHYLFCHFYDHFCLP